MTFKAKAVRFNQSASSVTGTLGVSDARYQRIAECISKNTPNSRTTTEIIEKTLRDLGTVSVEDCMVVAYFVGAQHAHDMAMSEQMEHLKEIFADMHRSAGTGQSSLFPVLKA